MLLLGLGMGHVQRGERLAHGIAVRRAVPQLAEQCLEATMILEDQFHHVTGNGATKVERGRCHGLTLLPGPRVNSKSPGLTDEDAPHTVG